MSASVITRKSGTVMWVGVQSNYFIEKKQTIKDNNYIAPEKCHFRNWRNFLIQPLLLGPTVDTYVESHL